MSLSGCSLAVKDDIHFRGTDEPKRGPGSVSQWLPHRLCWGPGFCPQLRLQEQSFPSSVSHFALDNYRMVWVGKDLIDHLSPTPLPWAGTPSIRPGCSKPHPTWPWTLPGRGQPQFLWATSARASPLSWWRIYSLSLLQICPLLY